MLVVVVEEGWRQCGGQAQGGGDAEVGDGEEERGMDRGR